MENKKWKCSMLKTNAKANLKRYYWWGVLVCIIMTIVSGGISGTINMGSSNLQTFYSESEADESVTLDTPYELGYVYGYQYGYESCQQGYTYSEEGLTDGVTENTKEYADGLVDGYHAGYYDCFNGSDYNSDPPVQNTDTDVSSENDKSLSLEEFVSGLANELGLSEEQMKAFTVIIIIILTFIISLSLAFFIFVKFPVIIGALRFFMCARNGNVAFGNVGYAFRKGQYLKVVKTSFVQNLYIFFWSLLFIIPGIIKSYSYALVPYILSENPTISTKKAIEISRKTMNGEKWNLFVLKISFILWYILGFIGCCGLGLIFINPYIQATYAEFYALMRQKALSFGYATSEDLPGYPEKPVENIGIPPYNPETPYGNSYYGNSFNNYDGDFQNSENSNYYSSDENHYYNSNDNNDSNDIG